MNTVIVAEGDHSDAFTGGLTLCSADLLKKMRTAHRLQQQFSDPHYRADLRVFARHFELDSSELLCGGSNVTANSYSAPKADRIHQLVVDETITNHGVSSHDEVEHAGRNTAARG